MKKAAIYPFTQENSYILSYTDLMSCYTLTGAITPKGSVMPQAPAADHPFLSDDYQALIDEADVLFLVDSASISSDAPYQEKCSYALRQEKTVLASLNLYRRFSTLLPADSLLQCSCLSEDLPLISGDTLVTIDIPVITIMGLGENCGKFELQLLLRRALSEKGLHILQLGSNALSPLFDFDMLPVFLFDDSLSLPQKILRFNHYMYQKTRNQNYDLILLGVPDGIMPYNKNELHHFGEIAYIISQALDIDVNIISLYFHPYLDVPFLKSIYQLSTIKFGCATQYFYLSGTMSSYDIGQKKTSWQYLNDEELHQHFPSFCPAPYRLYDCLHKDSLHQNIDDILEVLSDNIELV